MNVNIMLLHNKQHIACIVNFTRANQKTVSEHMYIVARRVATKYMCFKEK